MPSAERALEGLDPEQREAAEAVVGPVCIIAGAGTGKTRTITHRIAYGALTGAMPPELTLAVTFTARAAGEMRQRLRGLGVGSVQARTFHAAALRQLSYFWPRAIGGEMPRLTDAKIRLVAEAASQLRLGTSGTELRDLTSELEWAKATLRTPEQYAEAAAAAGRQAPRPPEVVARLYAAYEQVKQRRGVLDFDDLLLLTAAVIEEHSDVADELRSRYRHFVVDEFQDVNPLQQRVLDAWLGGRDDLCVVGDPNQTIYSFTGASPEPLLRFTRRYPEATVVRLVRDYRSTPQVVGLANSVIGKATGDRRFQLELRAQREPGPAPVFVGARDETDEAAQVAARIKRLVDAGVPPSEIAVLYRINAQSEPFEQALASAGVPYVLRGGERFFDRPEVREAVVLLRGAARAAEEGDPLVAQVEVVLGSKGWQRDRPPTGTGAERERWDNLAALVRLAEDLVRDRPGAGLEAFVAELQERADAQHAPVVEGVTLASLHSAKGLEWDAVFLVGLVEGMLPIVHASTPEQVEEERRVFYVGVTRARVHLVLTWQTTRGSGRPRTRTRFLDGIAPGSARPDKPARAAKESKPARCRVCGRATDGAAARMLGRCETCPGDLDQALFDQLRQWRLDQAKEQKVPAFCVFTDATLTAIAEARPTSVAELVALPGIGQAKVDRYGRAVLSLCRG